MLAKYYPQNRGIWFREEVCDFIDKHMEQCVPRKLDLDGNRVFDLYTENTTNAQAAQKISLVATLCDIINKGS